MAAHYTGLQTTAAAIADNTHHTNKKFNSINETRVEQQAQLRALASRNKSKSSHRASVYQQSVRIEQQTTGLTVLSSKSTTH